MKGLNRVTLIGTMGKDVEMRYAQSGTPIASFSLATNETWKDKQTGEKREATEWHNISIFGKLAEMAGQYLSKGSNIYLEGKIKTEKYTDQNGVEKYSTKIIADNLIMLGGNNNQQQGQQPAYQAQQPMQPQAPQQRPPAQPQRQPAQQPMPPANYANDFDDDMVPF
jgi:single-strand DNA-binding protein